MKIRIENQQKKPFYLPEAELGSAEWSANFSKHLPDVAKAYAVPTELVSQVAANNLVVQAVFAHITDILGWLTAWRQLRTALYEGNAISKSVMSFPPAPSFGALPDPVGPYIFAPHIQAVNIILANPALTETDRQLLRLVKVATPKRRETAEDFNYPLISGRVSNGAVVLRIKRGDRFKGRAVLIRVDKLGLGDYVNLINTTANQLSEPIQLPKGIHTAAWTFEAIYVDGTTPLSDWSKPLRIAVGQEVQPFAVPAPPVEQAVANAA